MLCCYGDVVIAVGCSSSPGWIGSPRTRLVGEGLRVLLEVVEEDKRVERVWSRERVGGVGTGRLFEVPEVETN